MQMTDATAKLNAGKRQSSSKAFAFVKDE